MPELLEVETMKRILEPQIKGRRVEEVILLRPEVIAHPAAASFCEQSANRTMGAVERQGKFLIFHLDNGSRIILHLRMTGCLLDQSVVAGIGNIYSDEILFAARFHPARPAVTLTADEWKRLAAAIPERLTCPPHWKNPPYDGSGRDRFYSDGKCNSGKCSPVKIIIDQNKNGFIRETAKSASFVH